MVGSHAAGSAVYKPLVSEAVGRLLGACQTPPSNSVDINGYPAPSRVCFVGIENKSSEELGDFKDQLYELIDAEINRADTFESISRRRFDAALAATGLRPDSLFIQSNSHTLAAVLQEEGQPLDYLIFATLTSGTTQRNSSTQRDYLLTLEMVNIRTGNQWKEQAEIRKGYHRSPLGKLANYSWFKPGH